MTLLMVLHIMMKLSPSTYNNNVLILVIIQHLCNKTNLLQHRSMLAHFLFHHLVSHCVVFSTKYQQTMCLLTAWRKYIIYSVTRMSDIHADREYSVFGYALIKEAVITNMTKSIHYKPSLLNLEVSGSLKECPNKSPEITNSVCSHFVLPLTYNQILIINFNTN